MLNEPADDIMIRGEILVIYYPYLAGSRAFEVRNWKTGGALLVRIPPAIGNNETHST